MPNLLPAREVVVPDRVTVDGVTLALLPCGETVSIGPFAGRLAALNEGIETGFGLRLPEDFRTIACTEGLVFFKAAHNQWFCSAREEGGLMARLSAACDGLAALTTQTDSRVTLRLSGPGAAVIASKLVPIDLHPSAFGPGRTALTLAGHIPVILSRPDASSRYEFMVFRSFAQSLHHDIHVAMKGGVPHSERVGT